MPSDKFSASNPGPTCQKIEDMIFYANGLIDRWPPYYKYTLGENIQNEMILMLRLATKARLRYMNKSTLSDLDTAKEVLSSFVRLANRTVFTDKSGSQKRLLRDHSFGVWSGYIEEIGRLIGGWMNAVSGRRNSDKGDAP